MSPRVYRLGERQASADATRARILAAARDVLTDPAGVSAFTVETVARRAAVARMTVYYQFESKWGLVEALGEQTSAAGLLPALRGAFARSEPADGLCALIRAFCAFWASDRVLIRRIRALALLDPEVRRSAGARDERKRKALGDMLARVGRVHRLPRSLAAETDVVHALTSFEMYDALAGPDGDVKETARVMIRLVRAELGLDRARGATR